MCIFAAGDDGEPVPVEDIDVCDLANLPELAEIAHQAAEDEAEEADWQLGGNPERTRLDPERFSFVPLEALVPRRYRRQPETAIAADRVRPAFTSLRYGDPGYGQSG